MSDASQLERLYDEHAQALFGFLLNLTRNEEDTRDLLQNVLIKVASQPELMRGIRNERSFLLRLAHNAAIDFFRRGQTREKQGAELAAELDSVFQISPDPDEASFRQALTQALAELPEEQRTVAHLKLWEGMTFETIAGLLEIPLNTAASRYRYALDKLRERLRPLYDEIK
jgi:RNA polymerase sigma-70 factor (ECF subfamily)